MAVPEAFYIWLISEVAGPEISTRVVEKLKPGWQRRLANASIELSGVHVSRRRLRNWLIRTDVWDRLVRSNPSDVADLVESLNGVVASDRRQRKRPPSEVAEATQRLLDVLVAQFLSELDPSLAQNVAHHREMWQFQRLDAGRREIRAILEDRGRFDAHVEQLPSPVAQALHEAYEDSPVSAARLAAYLSDGTTDPGDLIEHLWSERPPWLLEGSHLILVAVAEFASAHAYPETASDMFETLANQTSPDRRRWLARAGLAAQRTTETSRERRS